MVWANDDLANATSLSGGSGSITPLSYDGTTDPATSETGENVYSAGETLWWKWTAPSSGDFEFATVGSPSADLDPNGFDTILQVFSGPSSSPTHASLTFVVRNDDNAANDTYEYNSRAIFTATAGTTYYVQVDMYDVGQAGTLHLAWQPYVVPPPPPYTTDWVGTDTLGFGQYTLVAGVDDATVTGGDLDVVSTVTVGGVAQPFDVTSPTELVVHITSPAVSGPIVVANISGSSTAPPDAVVLYPGPWIQPADDVASEPNYAKATYGTDTTSGVSMYPAQPDIEGAPKRGDNGYVEIAVSNRAFPDVDTVELEWFVTGSVVLAQAEDPQYSMPKLPSGPIFTANPDAVEIEYEAEGGEAISDVDVLFGMRLFDTSEWVDDVDNKTAGDLTGDLWTTELQYRRLDTADWTSPDITHVELDSGTWPSKATIAALPLDFATNLFQTGETLTITTEDDSGVGLRIDNSATHDQDPDPDPQPSSVVLTWAEYETGMAWIGALDRFVDAAVIAPPYVSNDAVFPLQRKMLTARTELLLTWTYRPPRYRLYYETPQSTPVHPLRRRQQAAGSGSAPRRRQVGSRVGSLRRGSGAAP